MKDLLTTVEPESILIVTLVVFVALGFFFRIKRKFRKYFRKRKRQQQSWDSEIRQEPYIGNQQFNYPNTNKTTNDRVLVYKQILDFPIVRVEHIIDGDTVIVYKGRDEIKIRLDSIDCPEDGQHWGDTAKYGLIKLIGGRDVHLEEHGTDHYGRLLATIYMQNESGEWTNINERMVTLGHAWVLRKFYDHLPKERQEKLNRLEIWARSKKVGLWDTPDPVPPWEWRREEQEENSMEIQDEGSFR